jgi:hypothetical protein
MRLHAMKPRPDQRAVKSRRRRPASSVYSSLNFRRGQAAKLYFALRSGSRGRCSRHATTEPPGRQKSDTSRISRECVARTDEAGGERRDDAPFRSAHLSALDRSGQLDASFSLWAPPAFAVLCLRCALEESERSVVAAGDSTLPPLKRMLTFGMAALAASGSILADVCMGAPRMTTWSIWVGQ